MNASRPLVVALALMLVLAPVLPFAAAGPAAAAPAGMSTVPDGSVTESVPEGQTVPLSASELEGGVLASEHADSLEVILTTSDHAATVMNSDSAAVSGDGMALVLRDDEHSAGREVAIDAGELQQALGYTPEAIYGTHEDGSEWSASADYVDGYLVFDVPHFSDNTVTFSGEISINAQPAENGSSFAYSIANDSVVDNATVKLTGSDSTTAEQQSLSERTDGDTQALDIQGNQNVDLEVNISGPETQTKDEWNTSAGGRIYGVAVDSDSGTVVYGSGDGTVYAVDTATGEEKWTYSAGTDVQSGVAIHSGTVVVGDDNAVVYGIDLATGTEQWTYSASVSVESGVAIDGESDTAVVGDESGTVHGIDLSTGSGDWTYGTGASYVRSGIDFDPASGNVVAGDNDGVVHGINTSTGSADWTYNTGSNGVTGGIAIDSETAYFGDYNGDVNAVDTSTGSADWSEPTAASAIKSGVGVAAETVVVGGRDGKFRGLDRDTGSIEWSVSTGTSYLNAGIAADSGTAVGADGDGVVHGIDTATGEVDWTYSLGDTATSEVVVDPTTKNVPIGVYAGTVTALEVQPTVQNPEISVGGQTVSYDGGLTSEQSHKETLNGISPGDYTAEINASEEALNGVLKWTETTQTTDPSVTITSEAGSQTVEHTGSLDDGETVDLGSSVNGSLISGPTNVKVAVNDPGGPGGKVELEYRHTASNQITTSYRAATFEESYNVTTTYGSATDDARVVIPFQSSNVVGIKNIEYRVDGGSWSSVDPANRRFENTTLTAYLAEENGGSIPDNTTVGVRATGRKVSVSNGEVSVIDPTKPGDELDTQMRIDSRSDGFALDVGPTAEGDRVHYALSADYPTEDYAIIDSTGSQKLMLPDSKSGDTFRVRHLDTRVVAERGDVRIDVIEAGVNPEIDVSPGPGGAGDPVTIEYYNTETGVTYLLNSLKNSIVVDSDMAESPAIFKDDDSEDTWTILRDSGTTSSSSSDTGAVGQFAEQAGNTVGSVSVPGSGLGQVAILGVLGLGAIVVIRRVNPFGSSDSGDAASGSRADAREGSGSRIASVLERVLSWVSSIVSVVVRSTRASIALGVIGAIVAARVGLVQLPAGTGILIVVSGVPIASYLLLRRSGTVSQRVWLASTLVAVVLGLEFVAPGTVQTAIEQLTSEQVAPLLILVFAGGIFLWYRSRQSDRPQIVIGRNDE